MLNRHSVLKYIVPLVAMGALVFSCRRAAAAETGRLELASAVRGKPSRPIAAKKSSPAKAAPIPAPAPERKPVSPDAAWGQVNAESLNVRTGPSTQNAIVTTLRGGDFIKARAVQGGWLEIDWPKNVPAWVGKEFVKKNADGSGTGAVVSPSARIFSSGNLKAPVLANLDKGARVDIVGEEGAWYKIKAPETAAAFISAKYVLTGVQGPAAPETKIPEAPIAAAKQASPAPAPSAAPAAKVAAAEAAPEEPASLPAPAMKAELLAAVEKSRRQLESSSQPESIVSEPLPMVSRAVDSRKAEAEEQARRESETRRLEEIETARKAAEAKVKAEAEEQARRENETKRLEEIETARKAAEARMKAEAEEQSRREKELKAQEIETARLAAEAMKKAEAEEQARRQAEAKQYEKETKRLAIEAKKKAEAEEQARLKAEAEQQEAEIKRLAMEAKKKSDLEEQARRESTEKKNAVIPEAAKPLPSPEQMKIKSDDRGGLFVDPSEVLPGETQPAAIRALPEPSTSTRLLEPRRSHSSQYRVPANALPVARVEPAPIYVDNSAPARADDLAADAAAYNERVPDAIKRVRSKFVVPSGAPQSRKAEVLPIIEDEPSSESRLPVIEEPAQESSYIKPAVAVPPETSRVTAPPASPPVQPALELPVPAGDAPQSFRLKDHFKSQIRSADMDGFLTTAAGIVERQALALVEGVNYALVRDGRVLHLLAAGANVNLENYIGRSVIVTGMPVNGSAAAESVLEIASITASDGI